MKLSLLVLTAVVVVIGGCSSNQPKSEKALEKLESRFSDRVGKARKSELVEYFGTADWCRPNESTGGETCRFYKKTGTAWVGEKRDKKNYLQYDEVMVELDSKGILREFTPSAQR
jgi:hypothetical protein